MHVVSQELTLRSKCSLINSLIRWAYAKSKGTLLKKVGHGEDDVAPAFARDSVAYAVSCVSRTLQNVRSEEVRFWKKMGTMTDNR